MMMRRLACAWVVVALAGLWTSLGVAADDAQEKAEQGPDAAAMEKMMADFAKMTPQHEQFKKMAGRWKAESKNYWGNPEQPELSTGSATFKLLMGGRYLQQRYRGKYGGQKFEGLGICGYDKTKKKYVSLWIDNMGTGFMFSEGEYDEATKTLTEIGQSESPMGKMKLKTVTKDVDENKFIFTMYMVLPDGSETKGMEITYTRQPSGDAK